MGIFGTYLGAMRHKGLIPFDDDNDIAIMAENVRRIWNPEARQECEDNGYQLQADSDDYKRITVFQLTNLRVPDNTPGHESPGTDIFVMKRNARTGRLQFKNAEAQHQWGNNCSFEPPNGQLQRKMFGNYMIWVPKGRRGLDQCYPGWHRRWRIDDPHMHNLPPRVEPRQGPIKAAIQTARNVFKTPAPAFTHMNRLGVIPNPY